MLLLLQLRKKKKKKFSHLVQINSKYCYWSGPQIGITNAQNVCYFSAYILFNPSRVFFRLFSLKMMKKQFNQFVKYFFLSLPFSFDVVVVVVFRPERIFSLEQILYFFFFLQWREMNIFVVWGWCAFNLFLSDFSNHPINRSLL